MNRSISPTGASARPVARGAGLAMIVGAALLFATTGAVGAAEDGEPVDETPNITITTTPSQNQGECKPAALALSNVVKQTDTTFTLKVTASSPVCPNVDAVAVIYGMPGNGVAWPQQLLEREPFTIDEAGVYEITFTKTCAAVQFDVVTGATPQTIDPLGDKHGPLLFPFDVSTSLQFWGLDDCQTTTTTAAPTTTTPSSTTTSQPSVLASTTIAPEINPAVSTPGGPGGPGASPTQVGGISQTRPASLALTGSTNAGLAALGTVLLVAGLALVVNQRRRTA